MSVALSDFSVFFIPVRFLSKRLNIRTHVLDIINGY